MSDREVVITGMGLMTPLGKDCAGTWENLKAMKTGISYCPEDGPPDFLRHKARVKEFVVPDDLPNKLTGHMKFLNRGALLGFLSVREAAAYIGTAMADAAPHRRSLYVASGDLTTTGYEFMYPAIKEAVDDKWQGMDTEKLNNSALNKVNPFFLLESLHNNLFSFLSAFLEFTGPNTSLANLSPCGSHALELAYRSIKYNRADIALAAGYCNWITEIPMYELENLGILSGCKAGAKSFRPFDRHRDGFIPGEGGAALVLEAEDAAQKRGADILGRIKGTANYNELSGRGFSVPVTVTLRCMQMAMDNAGCKTSDMAFINPHGSGTIKGDRSELISIAKLLGSDSRDIPLCGMKPYTGHMGAASDIAEVVLGIKALKDRIAPATLNFEKTEAEFADLRISNTHQTCKRNHFMSVSYGIGGQSSAVVIEV